MQFWAVIYMSGSETPASIIHFLELQAYGAEEQQLRLRLLAGEIIYFLRTGFQILYYICVITQEGHLSFRLSGRWGSSPG